MADKTPSESQRVENVKSVFEAATFEEIDFSEYRNDESSPSHDSNCSGVFSPVSLDDDNDNELVHDADFDSSDQESKFDPYRDRNQRKVKRRTSSNVFTFKKNGTADTKERSLQKINQFNVNNDAKTTLSKSKQGILKWTQSASFSSSTEEIEARKQSPQKLHNNVLIQSSFNQSMVSAESSEETMISLDTTGIGLTPPKSKATVDGLLFEIYDRYNRHSDSHVMDSDITELSTTSVSSIYVASAFENEDRQKFDQNYLETKGINIFIIMFIRLGGHRKKTSVFIFVASKYCCHLFLLILNL